MMRTIRYWILAGLMVVCGQNAAAYSEPQQGCNDCDPCNLATKDGLACGYVNPAMDDSQARYPKKIGIWGASDVDNQHVWWRLMMIIDGYNQTGWIGVTHTNLSIVRHWDRPWTSTGMYWKDYATQSRVLARGERNREDPKIVLVCDDDGWRATRETIAGYDGHRLSEKIGSTYVGRMTSRYQWYVLLDTEVDNLKYTYDFNGDGQPTVENLYEGGVLSQKTFFNYIHDPDTGFLVRKRISEQRFDSAGNPSVKVTIYGYYPLSRNIGRLKFILRPEKTAKYISDHPGSGISLQTPGHSSELDGYLVITDEDLLPYASLVCEHYEEAMVTDIRDWDQDLDEGEQIMIYRVKKIRVDGNSVGGTTCIGAGLAAGRYLYSYAEASGIGNSYWRIHATRIDDSDNPIGAKTSFFVSRDDDIVAIAKHDEATGKVWIEHNVVDGLGRVLEHRTPAACAGYAYSIQGGYVTSITPTDTTEGLVECGSMTIFRKGRFLPKKSEKEQVPPTPTTGSRSTTISHTSKATTPATTLMRRLRTPRQRSMSSLQTVW